MVKRVLVLACVLGLLCASAQAAGKGKKEKGGEAKGGIGAVLAGLNLAEEQKPKVDAAMATYQEKSKAAASKEEKKQARQEFEAELEKVLTPEQMTKYREEMKAQHEKAKKPKGEGQE
ncbi:MAG: hypothetical protein AB1696_00065 [Planctomycetota bacterium]